MSQSRKAPGNGPGRRGRGRRVPSGASTDRATTDPAAIVDVGSDVDTDVATLLSDDPALALGPLPAGLIDTEGQPLRLPVVH